MAVGTLQPIVAGLKFFYRVTCPRPEWTSLQAIRLPKSRTLPVILSREQVQRLLDGTQLPHFRAFFQVCYTCGLRLGDGRGLQPGDIDAQRGQARIRNSKGSKDRIVPIPAGTIALLREFWQTHRNRHLMFPSRSPHSELATTTRAMSERSIQRAFQIVVGELDLAKTGLRLHSLRHSYATHLLDDGVNLKVLQHYLGHTTLQTTEIYLQLTQQGDEQARPIIEGLLPRESLDDRPRGGALPPRIDPAEPPEDLQN